MSLRHAVLAALLEGEASGYELSKRFAVSVGNYWSSTPQQLYRELERMEADGVVDAHVVQQERRPNKRVFAITPAGRDALLTFTQTTPRPTAGRDELLVQVQAADVGDLAAVAATITTRVQQSEVRLALFERLRADILAGRTEEELLAGSDRIGPYLTVTRGITFERENLAWGAWAGEILRQRAAARSPA